MRIVDGIHRFQAAKARGEAEIDVHWYDGDDRSAFLFSVPANIRQRLQLPAREGLAAA
ncbi:hypothetical protein [Solicola gregarius]|uniref:ParB/Sulfiredoxin domain-containing protein n=1 Tax=Solicola gregarius TaxID=2908642 RepID=A0AA46TJ86_9ACTN|nr:hypothetical protein [Solicola gregarius]UYM06280.1 hypothetical protein L0C25_04165 [Solicola gregarius]